MREKEQFFVFSLEIIIVDYYLHTVYQLFQSEEIRFVQSKQKLVCNSKTINFSQNIFLKYCLSWNLQTLFSIHPVKLEVSRLFRQRGILAVSSTRIDSATLINWTQLAQKRRIAIERAIFRFSLSLSFSLLATREQLKVLSTQRVVGAEGEEPRRMPSSPRRIRREDCRLMQRYKAGTVFAARARISLGSSRPLLPLSRSFSRKGDRPTRFSRGQSLILVAEIVCSLRASNMAARYRPTFVQAAVESSGFLRNQPGNRLISRELNRRLLTFLIGVFTRCWTREDYFKRWNFLLEQGILSFKKKSSFFFVFLFLFAVMEMEVVLNKSKIKIHAYVKYTLSIHSVYAI